MLVALAIAAASLPVIAQPFPAKPIRAVLPFTPGGLSDVVLRALAAEMARNVGQPVIVENRGGGMSLIGAEVCARAAPDGYTICLLAVETTSIAPFVVKKSPIDPRRDFTPITNVFYLKVGFMTNPAVGVKTLQEFIAAAKKNPGRMNYGSTANNVAIFMNEFNRVNGTDIAYIPYKGGGEAVAALLGNQVQALVFGIGNLVGHLKSGKLILLAVDGTERSPLFPNVPTLGDSGYRGISLRAWFGLLGPAGMPRPIVTRLNAEVGKVVSQPAFREKQLGALGLEPALNTPEAFEAFLREDVDKGEKLVRQAGLSEQ